MRLSISRSRESLWVWMFWFFGGWLVLEAGTFFAAGWALKLGVRQLGGPYVAFAMPAAIFGALVYWLKKREEKGEMPKCLARDWGISFVLFLVGVTAAVCYSGTKLGLMSGEFAADGAIGGLLVGVPVGFFGTYRMTLARLSAKARPSHGQGSQTPPAP